MRVFTVCTSRAGWFDALAASCERHGLQLVVLGAGLAWQGFAWRFRLMREAIAEADPDECVAFVDAYDVVILEHRERLLDRYRRLTRGGRRILFGCEVPLGGYFQRQYAHMLFGGCDRDGRRRVLNAGVYVGPCDLLRELLDRLISLSSSNGTDDQKLINRVCNTDLAPFFRDHVERDEHGWVIYTAACPNVLRYVDGACDTLGLHRPGLQNPRTGVRPCIVHATTGMDMNPICRLEGLPAGAREGRLAWYASNFWREALFVALLFALLVLLVRRITRIPRTIGAR